MGEEGTSFVGIKHLITLKTTVNSLCEKPTVCVKSVPRTLVSP